MNNNRNIIIPEIVLEAFPLLSRAAYIRRFAALIPLSPDMVFDIFQTNTGQFFALVTTDYADPLDDSQILKKASGRYKFEFVDLVKPYANNEKIEILEHDDMEGDCVVKDTASYYYYYLATTRQNLDW